MLLTNEYVQNTFVLIHYKRHFLNFKKLYISGKLFYTGKINFLASYLVRICFFKTYPTMHLIDQALIITTVVDGIKNTILKIYFYFRSIFYAVAKIENIF